MVSGTRDETMVNTKPNARPAPTVNATLTARVSRKAASVLAER